MHEYFINIYQSNNFVTNISSNVIEVDVNAVGAGFSESFGDVIGFVVNRVVKVQLVSKPITFLVTSANADDVRSPIKNSQLKYSCISTRRRKNQKTSIVNVKPRQILAFS